MHKATALERHVQPDTMNTLLLYYTFPQNHVFSIYWEDKLSKLGTAFVPATHSPVLCFLQEEGGLLTGPLT